MTKSLLYYVVDGSVGIKLFVDEEFSEQAHALLSHLDADPPAELYLLYLSYIECTNILLKSRADLVERLKIRKLTWQTWAVWH